MYKKTFKELLLIEIARKLQIIMEIQFLTSDISKTIGPQNLKKFMIITNE